MCVAELARVAVLSADEPPAPTMPGEVMPPVGYSIFWLWLGVALLIGVATFYLLLWWFTRKRPQVTMVEVDEASPVTEFFGLSQVDAVEARVRNGELSAREGYEQLSRIVRGSVQAATGLPADRMNLTELRRAGLLDAAYAVEFLYPGEFAPQPQYDFDRALALSRDLIAMTDSQAGAIPTELDGGGPWS